MRPCQQCNGPVENQQRRCPSCGAVQVPSVGLTAPLVGPPPEVDEEEWRERFEEDFGKLDPPLELANTRSNVPWHWRDGKK